MIRLGQIGLVVAAAAALACGSKSKAPEGGDKPKVAVSIFPLYDVTRRIAGDRLNVMLVLPAGQSEHGYDPTPKEIAALDGSKLGIAVGLEMDRWVENIMKSAGNPTVFRAGEKVKTIPIDLDPISEEDIKEHAAHKHEHDDDHGKKDDHDKGSATKHDDHDDHDDHDKKGSAAKKDDHDDDHDKGSAKKADNGSAKKEGHHHDHGEVGSPDPHFWMDPDRMIGVIDAIAEQLATLDPGGKTTFQTNADALKKSLRELDAKLAKRVKSWSKSVIVTFHGSMAYFAKRYGILIAAVVEPVAGTEPTAAYIDQVVAAVKRGKAVALFTEPQLSKGPGEAIAREAGIPLGELDPVGGVAGRDSYEALLNWNADQLEKVLK